MKLLEKHVPSALRIVERVLSEGENTHENPWTWLAEDNLAHAVEHIRQHKLGDKSEAHLFHAACRMLMEVEMFIRKMR